MPFDVDFGDGGPGGFTDLLGDLLGNRGGRGGRRARRRVRSAGRISRPSCTCRSTTRCAASRARAVPADATCSTCNGSGAAPGTRPETCPECHGSGSIAVDQGPFSFSQVCPTCGGRGQVIPTPCPTCKGSGVEMRAARGEGARARRCHRRSAHPREGPRRRGRERRTARRLCSSWWVCSRTRCSGGSGNDLTIRLPVTFAEATLGADVKVPTLDGQVTMRIPPGHAERQGDARARPGAPRAQKTENVLVTLDVIVPDRARRRAARGGRGAARRRLPTTRGRRCSRSSTTEGAPMDDTRALYVISVAAELAGVHPQTLRIYERKGLLAPRAHERPEPPLLRARHLSCSAGSRSSPTRASRSWACNGSSTLEQELARPRVIASPRLEAHGRVAAAGDGRARSPPRTSSTGARSSRCARRRVRARPTTTT